jgi:hypothetical protein
MDAVTRRKLAMGSRVRDFSRENTSTEPAYVQVLGDLEARLARADQLDAQQRGGETQQREAVIRRTEIRRTIQSELLPNLVRVGQAIAVDRPDLAGRFRLPNKKLPLRSFVSMSRGMFTQAVEDKTLFVARGLAPTLLDDLGKALDAFDRATEESHEGRRDHVGATAELVIVADEIVKLVGQLDGLNRYRFRDNPELKAAWDSARNVVGPFRSKKGSTGSQDGGTPSGGGLSPAA